MTIITSSTSRGDNVYLYTLSIKKSRVLMEIGHANLIACYIEVDIFALEP
jgi:hypothetical protein